MQTMRLSIVFGVLQAVTAFVLRIEIDSPVIFGETGRISSQAAVPGFLGLLFMAVTLCLVIIMRGEELPQWLMRASQILWTPILIVRRVIVGAMALTLVGMAIIIGTGGGFFQRASATMALLALPNFTVDGLALGTGAGLHANGEGFAGFPGLGQSSEKVHVSDLVDGSSAWYWAVPIATLVIFTTIAVLCAVYSDSATNARKTALQTLVVTTVATPFAAHLATVHIDARAVGSGLGSFGPDWAMMFLLVLTWMLGVAIVSGAIAMTRSANRARHEG